MRDTDWRPSPCPICGETRGVAEKPVCLSAGCGKKEVPGFDPYHNRIPQGLLTDEENAALEATGGPWEYCDPRQGMWQAVTNPDWFRDCVYRAVRKPLPVPQAGDVWVRTSNWAEFWLQAKPNDPLAAALIADGYRLFREVKA
jgi:hypothetical protein